MADVFGKAQFFRESVERNAAHNARAHLCEKAFGLGGISVEEIVGYSGAQHGVAKVFHAFVADVVVAHFLGSHRLMGESHAIQSDVLRIEAEDIVDILVEC